MSVDGFQGREKEAIIISTVRSNPRHLVGFLSDHRRMNVAVTRARRHLAIIGDGETMCSDAHLATLVEYLCEHADLRSAHEYGDTVASHTGRAQQRRKHATAEQEREHGQRLERERLERERAKAEARGRLMGVIKHHVAYGSHQRPLAFPATLSSLERLVAHEIAEELGLLHGSEGEGADRRLTITLQQPQPGGGGLPEAGAGARLGAGTGLVAVEAGVQSDGMLTADSGTGGNEVAKFILPERPASPAKPSMEREQLPLETDAGMVICNTCRKGVPELNMDIHRVRCERAARLAAAAMTRQESAATPGNGQPAGSSILRKSVAAITAKKGAGKPAAVKGKAASRRKLGGATATGGQRLGGGSGLEERQLTAAEERDAVDALLAAMVAQDNTCSFTGCSASTTLISLRCPHCGRRLCVAHGAPEAHGCTDAARRKGRASAKANGARIQNGFLAAERGPKPPSEVRHMQIQKKLQNTLKEKQAQRKKHGGKEAGAGT